MPEFGDKHVARGGHADTCVHTGAGIAAASGVAVQCPDTGCATNGGIAAALMLATSRLLASTGRPEFCPGRFAGVERLRANEVSR